MLGHYHGWWYGRIRNGEFPNIESPNDSRLASGTAASGAVTQRKTGTNPKRARPAEHAASQRGKSAKNVNLTGVALVKVFPFKTRCPVVRNSVTPIPG